MTFRLLVIFATLLTATVQTVYGHSSTACYGTDRRCDFYSMDRCNSAQIIRLRNLYAGYKNTNLNQFQVCGIPGQHCSDPLKCCTIDQTNDVVEFFNEENTYNTFTNCSGKQICTDMHAPWQQLQTRVNGATIYSSYVHVEYDCEEASTKIPFCGGYSGTNTFNYAEIMFDGSAEALNPSKASNKCQCNITNTGQQQNVIFTTIDVRLESHYKGENQTSANCSSAHFQSYVLSARCVQTDNHYQYNFYRENRQQTLVMGSGMTSEITLTDIHVNGLQDAPVMVWISLQAEQNNNIKITCEEVTSAQFTTSTTTTTPTPTTTTTTPKPTTTTTTTTSTTTSTTTTTPKPTTTTTTPKPTTTTTTTTPKPTTTTTTTTPKPTTTTTTPKPTTTKTTPKPTTTTTTTTPKPTTTTTTTTPKPTTTTTTTTPKPTTTTTTPKPTTTTTTTTPKPTTTTTTTTPKPTTTTTTAKPTTTTTTTTPKPTTTTKTTTPQPTTSTTTTTTKPTTSTTTTTTKPTTTTTTTTTKPTTTTTTTTPKPTTTTTRTTTSTTTKPTTTSTTTTPRPETTTTTKTTTTTSTSSPVVPTTVSPQETSESTTTEEELTTSVADGVIQGDGESDRSQRTAVYLAIIIPIIVCLLFITALLLWIYWKRTSPRQKKFHFMKDTPRSDVYNTFSNPMILDEFIKDEGVEPRTPITREKPPITSFVSVPEPQKRPRSILSNGSAYRQQQPPAPYVIPVNVTKSDSLYTTPRNQPVQNGVHVRLNQDEKDKENPVIITETIEPEARPVKDVEKQPNEPVQRQSTLKKKQDDADGSILIHVDNLSLPPVSARSVDTNSARNTSSTRSEIGSTPGNLTPERRNSEPAIITTDPIVDRHSASAYVLPGSSPEDGSVLFVP